MSDFHAEKHGIDRTDEWLVLKLHQEVGELTQAYLARSGQAWDKGRSRSELDDHFRAELTDVLAQVPLFARRFDIDLEAEVARKWLVWKPANKTAGRCASSRYGS
ncbi:MazG nucleotide pyrophosphohydrolase domain-containing protein [Frigoribacterium salinisoli]